MIRTLVISIAIVSGLWLLFRLLLRFLAWDVFTRRESRTKFEHHVKSMLLLLENGGILRITHRTSEIHFDFVRASGSDKDAELVLSIPRAEWSEAARADLERVFETQNFDASFGDGLPEGVLGEVRMHIPDIWHNACGARGARAAHLLVDTLSIPHDAEFAVAFLGPRSDRLRKKYWPPREK